MLFTYSKTVRRRFGKIWAVIEDKGSKPVHLDPVKSQAQRLDCCAQGSPSHLIKLGIANVG